MQRRRLVLTAVALVLAIGGAGSLWWYAQTADQRAAAGLATVDVFVAKQDIPAGTSLGTAIGSGMLAVQQIPRRLAPTGATTSVSATDAGNLAVTNIRTGELVLLSEFTTPQTAASGLAVPDGQIAVSVDVADTPRVGNFVHPGSHVAVFLLYPSADGKGKETRLLLSDVLVLAVGDSTDGSTGASQVPSTRLTVAVDQRSAEKLIQSTTVGTLYLGLMTSRSTVGPAPALTTNDLFR